MILKVTGFWKQQMAKTAHENLKLPEPPKHITQLLEPPTGSFCKVL